jgi:electron transfer flavoprotein alpha/beta subunit
MTNCTSHSGKGWESRVWFEAEAREGVRYEIVRVSFGRRIELARRIREIGRRMEYLEAGSDARETLEATVLAAGIDRAYLDWGLVSVEGLEIDGAAATPETLVDRGPVELAMEILRRIKAECGMTEDERKN